MFVIAVRILSFVLSLTRTLMTTIMQQWARQYPQLTPRNHPPHIQAHIREYFALNADMFPISALVEALPALLISGLVPHLSRSVLYSLMRRVYFGAARIS